MGAEELPGGFVSAVVRVGDTVRRSPGPSAPYVRQVLEFLALAGWPGSPRFLGVDEHGRDILSFIDGYVPWQPSERARVGSDLCLAATAALMRQFHDLTAGTPLADGAEVVCHNDLSPANTVYRDTGSGLSAVAFLDWDLAAAGARIHDIAHMCWQYPGLGPSVPDIRHASRQVRVICDSYQLDDRGALIDTILWWQDRCQRGIRSGAAAGDPAMMRLNRAGVPAAIRDEMHWVARHRADLEAALR